jgi:hypothetical protein
MYNQFFHCIRDEPTALKINGLILITRAVPVVIPIVVEVIVPFGKDSISILSPP